MNIIGRIAVISFCAIALASSGRAEDKQWWQYSYEGNALPYSSTPTFVLNDPQVKSGMQITDTLKDGVLSMTCIGEGARHYYAAAWSGSGQVWRGDSNAGTTVEARVRVPRTAYGCAMAGMVASDGYGEGGNCTYALLLSPKSVNAGGKSYTIDMSEFHTLRYTYNPKAKLFTFYIDEKKISETPLSAIKPNSYKSNRIYFGATDHNTMQGTIDIDYVRWSCDGAFAPK